ncbi:MAG: hypothetical protein EBS76_07500, partial [Actinobacteria bacterium]|nr:hypothetical protein [Actinomycetota bacterium]
TLTETEVSCDVQALTTGTKFQFRVVAENDRGESARSQPSSTFITPPGQPTNLSLSNDGSTGDLTVTWSAPSGAVLPTAYTIVLLEGSSDVATATWASGTLSQTFDFVESSLTYGTSYTAKVSAANGSNYVGTDGTGYGARSAASISVVASAPPSQPNAPTVTAGAGSVTVEWVAPSANGSAITGYAVEGFQNGEVVDGVGCETTTATTCEVTDLAVEEYAFTVKATNQNGSSSRSAFSSAVTPLTPLQSQSISVSQQPSNDVEVGSGPVLIVASALGGVAVQYSTLTSLVCSIASPSSGEVTLLTIGNCQIKIDASETSSYEAATRTIQFAVVADSGGDGDSGDDSGGGGDGDSGDDSGSDGQGGWRAGLQKLGGNLAGMVIPNIGAFIAWGLLTALFNQRCGWSGTWEQRWDHHSARNIHRL